MASDGGTAMAVYRSLAWVELVFDHDQDVGVECAPCLHGGALSLHVESVISTVLGYDSLAASIACASSWEMQSGCGGVSRMASCRGGGGGGGGGVDVSAEPCPDWVPFWRVFGGRLSILRDCDDACDPYSRSSRAKVLRCASLMDDCGCRWCDVWRNPSQRVAPVTMALCRRCALGGAPWVSLGPEKTDPQVSTGLYPGPVASQPCRRE
jgi:hypothetical protein